MRNKTKLPLPAFKALKKLGKDLSHARKRRRITMELMAQRAGITRVTLSKIEKGDATVSMASYAHVLFIFGLTDRLKDLADASIDLIGRELEEENLPQRVRKPYKKTQYREDNE